MSELERIRLDADIGEASALLPVESASLIASVGGPAWWLCHDEGDLDSMLSLLVEPNDTSDDWSVLPIALVADSAERTDAEALTRVGDQILVVGSAFGAKAGAFDARRAFIARFDEGDVSIELGSVPATVTDLGEELVERITASLAAIDLLPADDERRSFNIEGAAAFGPDLLLGMRWPVAANGDPLIARLVGAAEVCAAPSMDGLQGVDVVMHIIDSGAGTKRPEGIRGMAVVGDDLHVLTGQTERSLAARKIKAGASRHVKIDVRQDSLTWSAVEVQRFEGFRKVEALAPREDGRWLYALDDEDAIVILTSG